VTRVEFTEVGITFYRGGTCTVCGKRRRRRKRLWQTLNPWNKNAAGEPKSGQEIMAELRIEGKAWEATPFVCASCEVFP
jgi:hypothetical protein